MTPEHDKLFGGKRRTVLLSLEGEWEKYSYFCYLTVHFYYLFIKLPTNASNFSFLWFFAPTCFVTYMPSSGSPCVPSKLLAHLRLLWVKSARWMEVNYCLLPRCVAIATQRNKPKKLKIGCICRSFYERGKVEIFFFNQTCFVVLP
jgi:hypothetical protein